MLEANTNALHWAAYRINTVLQHTAEARQAVWRALSTESGR
ncbi:hypothetical protein ACFQU2_03935 [Siccirubricoccus deserti]